MLVLKRYAPTSDPEGAPQGAPQGGMGRVEHRDHVMLLREGMARPGPRTGEVWADLGSGKGAFTLALADLLGPGAVIHSVDRDERALKAQRQAVEARFQDASVQYWRADFTGPVNLPPLDGVLMANSLHFV